MGLILSGMRIDRVQELTRLTRAEVGSLDADAHDPVMAAALVEAFAELSRAADAGVAVLARKVEDARMLATVTKTSVGKARAVRDVSQCLATAPELGEAVRTAQVSLDQATIIARAEGEAPGSAAALVQVAKEQPMHVLREEARAQVLADDRKALAARQHQARRASHWVTHQGMIHIEADLEPHIGAPIVNRLEAAARRRSKDGKGSWEQHLADAFAGELSGDGTSGGKPEVVVLVSHEVAERGWTSVEDGERCEIPGVGPIDPAAAREIAQDAFISGVVFDGTDLRTMKRWGRSIPVEVRTALMLGKAPEFKGARCVDCGNRFGLEMDHVVPLSEGGETSLANIEPRCELCHDKKTAQDRGRAKSGGGSGTREAADRAPP